MGRKKRPPTVVLRLPLRHKQQILDYVSYLKQSEITPQAEQAEQPTALQTEPLQTEQLDAETPVILGLIEQWGIVDLQQIAKNYGVDYFGQDGRMLPKEELREKMKRFFMEYTKRGKSR
jgi:hypothetical protein